MSPAASEKQQRTRVNSEGLSALDLLSLPQGCHPGLHFSPDSHQWLLPANKSQQLRREDQRGPIEVAYYWSGAPDNRQVKRTWAWRSLDRQPGKKKKYTPGTLRGWDPRPAKGLLDSCQLLHAPLSVPSAPSEVLELQQVGAFTASSTALGKFPLPVSSFVLASHRCAHALSVIPLLLPPAVGTGS